MEIVPAILETELMEIEEKIRLMEGLAKWVSIDIVDGKFAKPETWPYSHGDELEVVSDLNDIKTDLKIELHLMVRNPERDLDRYIDTPAKRILVHFEAAENHDQALALLDMSTEECGLVLNLNTPISAIEPYVKYLDFVQMMSIAHDGGQGAPFEDKVLEKVKAFKKKHPSLRVQLDGGVNERNIKIIKDAGVDSVAVGSAIFAQADPRAAFKHLQSLV